MYIVYIKEVLRRIHKRVPTDKICTCCFVNKQYVKGIKKKQRMMDDELYGKVMLVLLYHVQAGDTSQLFKEQSQKSVRMDFEDCNIWQLHRTDTLKLLSSYTNILLFWLVQWLIEWKKKLYLFLFLQFYLQRKHKNTPCFQTYEM